ncbi:MAG: ThuA domain-containing protein, partial [candidate division Zixibacteria bacterium]|nr:ThuA domain-containing protein [candidate division Zixibacteria bacterium]
MKKYFAVTIVFVLLTSVAFASTFDATSLPVVKSNNSPVLPPEIDQYNPTVQIMFQGNTNGNAMSITCDGLFYYEIGYDGYIATYDLGGNPVSLYSMSGGITAVRSVFYNPDDSLLYFKPWGTDLMTVDPNNGTTAVVYPEMFQSTNGQATLDICTGQIYEQHYGNVWIYDITTGLLIDSLELNPQYGSVYTITTNHDHLFTAAYGGGTVYVYERDGTYVESINCSLGDYEWTLSYCFFEELLYIGEQSSSTWFGYSGVEGSECPDTFSDVSIDMIPHNPPINVLPGNSFDFTGTLTNNTGSPQSVDVAIYLKDVPWGGFYGPILMFHDIPLDPYEVYIDSSASQFVPGYAVLGDYTYIAYCGDFPATPYDSAWFDFTITDGSGGYNVGIVCSDFDNDWSEVQSLLLANGEINSANFTDARYTTPTLANLLAFDVVIVWSNLEFADNIALGDVLADYVEAGGGVVTAEFCHLSGSFSLAGRYMNDYSPMGTGPTGFVTTNLVVDDAGHPIMAGVTTGTEYFDFNAPLQGNTNMVQHWDNGYNGVVVNTDVPRCVAMNDNFGTSYRQWTGDIGQMMV